MTSSPPKPDIEPVATLVERLNTRADTMNGVRPVGAGDGDTYTLGYYSPSDRRLDREAASALLALEGERDRLVRILSYPVDTSIKERGWDFRHDPDTVEYVVKLLRGDEQ
jgi:hypothetical protein